MARECVIIQSLYCDMVGLNGRVSITIHGLYCDREVSWLLFFFFFVLQYEVYCKLVGLDLSRG